MGGYSFDHRGGQGRSARGPEPNRRGAPAAARVGRRGAVTAAQPMGPGPCNRTATGLQQRTNVKLKPSPSLSSSGRQGRLPFTVLPGSLASCGAGGPMAVPGPCRTTDRRYSQCPIAYDLQVIWLNNLLPLELAAGPGIWCGGPRSGPGAGDPPLRILILSRDSEAVSGLPGDLGPRMAWQVH